MKATFTMRVFVETTGRYFWMQRVTVGDQEEAIEKKEKELVI